MIQSKIVKLLVDAGVSDELIQKEFAEIALRNADAKFKSFVKCQILGESSEQEETIKIIVDSIGNAISPDIKQVRNLLSQINVSGTNISNNVKNLSLQIENVYSYLEHLSSSNKLLSFINTGLSLTNLAVNIEGFKMVNKKLFEIQDQLDSINNSINTLLKYNKEELKEDYRNHYNRTQFIYNDIISKKPIDLNKLRDEIGELSSFIIKLKDLFDFTYNTIYLLKMINALLPAYTFLLREYLDLMQGYPTSKENDLSVYNKVLELYDGQQLFDLLFLNNELHVSEAWDIIYAQRMFVINNRTQIEDKEKMISLFPSKQLLCDFEQNVTKIIIDDMKTEKIPTLAKETSIDESEYTKVLDEIQQRFMDSH